MSAAARIRIHPGEQAAWLTRDDYLRLSAERAAREWDTERVIDYPRVRRRGQVWRIRARRAAAADAAALALACYESARRREDAAVAALPPWRPWTVKEKAVDAVLAEQAEASRRRSERTREKLRRLPPCEECGWGAIHGHAGTCSQSSRARCAACGA